MTRRIVLVGPLPIEGERVGGTKISFHQLVEFFQSRETVWAPTVINTSRLRIGRSAFGRAWTASRTLFTSVTHFASSCRHAEIAMLNISPGGLLSAGPIFWVVSKAARVPLVVRVFGGDLDLFLERASTWRRYLAARTVLRGPLLLQTKMLVAKMKSQFDVHWLPTVRATGDAQGQERDAGERHARMKVLFLGQVRWTKGIREILNAAEALGDKVSINIYGPFLDGVTKESLIGRSNVAYCGVVDNEDVQNVLERHDVLLFPSYHEGEGYPGSVIEALQSGLPVIATNWRAIPELIEENECGLLCEPRDAECLVRNIERLRLEPDLYEKLSANARRAAEQYRTDQVYPKLERLLLELV